MVREFGYYVSKVILLLALCVALLFAGSLFFGVFLRLELLAQSGTVADWGQASVTAVLFTVVMSAAMVALG